MLEGKKRVSAAGDSVTGDHSANQVPASHVIPCSQENTYCIVQWKVKRLGIQEKVCIFKIFI